MPRYRWIEPDVSAGAGPLSRYGLLGSILATRGLRSPADVESFLRYDLDSVPDPSTLPDVDRAAERIRTAIDTGEPVAVFGDYDVDGLTSTALLLRSLGAAGADIRAYLPHRERDGYGLNLNAVQQAARAGCTLLITVDCGTSDRQCIEYAHSSGLDVIVIDHHHVPDAGLPAHAFVSPKRPDSEHGFADYAAVGVAFQVLRHTFPAQDQQWLLPLVALGTVADVVPLSGPNRVFVHHGLELFEQYASPGLQALARVSGLSPSALRSHHFGFMLGPRINAAGRIDDPWLALKLLLAEKVDEARTFADELDRLNRHRQELLDRFVQEARIFVESDGVRDDPVLVVHSPDWRIGLVGLVASRLSEEYSRPVFALEQNAPLSRGSARSIDEFDVVQALHRCSELLEQFGGHSKAAGLTLETNRIGEFATRINELFVDDVGPEPPIPSLSLDAELRPELVSLDLVDELSRLEPCGHGNPSPRFLVRDAPVADARRSKDQSHLLFNVPLAGLPPLRAVSFNAGDRLVEIDRLRRADLAVSLRPNTWKGRTSVTLEVVDFRDVI